MSSEWSFPVSIPHPAILEIMLAATNTPLFSTQNSPQMARETSQHILEGKNLQLSISKRRLNIASNKRENNGRNGVLPKSLPSRHATIYYISLGFLLSYLSDQQHWGTYKVDHSPSIYPLADDSLVHCNLWLSCDITCIRIPRNVSTFFPTTSSLIWNRGLCTPITH